MQLRRFLLSPVLFLSLSQPAFPAEGDAQFSVSPESAYSLLEPAIREAKESIELNIYMLTNRNIAQALADVAQQKKVKVTVLLEGETFGGEILAPVKRVLDDLYLRFDQQSDGRGRFLVMSSQGGKARRRYVFDHAKYLVIDGKKVFVSSENFTGSAFNRQNLSGGTRGWQILVENSSLAGALHEIFAQDADEAAGDVVPYQKAEFKVKDPGSAPLPPRQPRTVKLFPLTRGKVSSARICASPGSLACVIEFIRGARSELQVQQLSLPRWWVGRNGAPDQANPIVEELLAAARRGVKLRVLLNDDSSFGEKNGGTQARERNGVTVAYFLEEAAKGKLPLEAALFRHQALQVSYVHNKGMLADGKRVFLGSINGTENSVKNNREISLALQSPDAARYFGEVFLEDWSLSVAR